MGHFKLKNSLAVHQTLSLHESRIWPRKTKLSINNFACLLDLVKTKNTEGSRLPIMILPL